MSGETRKICLRRVAELLQYTPETGNFVWRVYRGGKALPGSPAGGTCAQGYRSIGVDGRLYKAHRLAFALMTGEWPDCVDHRNGDPSDNRWENLRGANKSLNGANQRISKTSTTGLKGVHQDKRTQRYRAKIVKDQRQYNLGCFDTAQEAHDAYVAAGQKLFGEFFKSE